MRAKKAINGRASLCASAVATSTGAIAAGKVFGRAPRIQVARDVIDLSLARAPFRQVLYGQLYQYQSKGLLRRREILLVWRRHQGC
ncbi:unannotated protein [freshwater metagenome]|uniref:Unannotated protein n=1 Tax=freshwater metagenome TaxID=449393 RepID=A0A6J6XFX8_9ZZZZ